MEVTIQPSKVSGVIQAPASKSSMQRACAAALLSGGKSIIRNPGCSNDDRAALGIIQSLGAEASNTNDALIITSEGYPFSAHHTPLSIHCGESGLSIRMFTPIAALSSQVITVTGEGSLASRPMDFFDKVLPQLGVQIQSNDGKLPLVVKGPLQPKNIEIDGSISSQFLTGLLMAYSAARASAVSIKVNNLNSSPYVDLTLAVMKQFGMTIPENRNYREFYFFSQAGASREDGLQDTPREYTVEGDWSGGAFLLVAGAVAGEVLVNGLQNASLQADKRIVDALLDAGAEVVVTDHSVSVKKKKLEAFHFDATDCPDLFPPLVALAANCRGITTIRGLRRLKHKESDRGLTLKAEFEKLSTEIDLNDDEMIIYGNQGIFVKNHILNSHHDHRISMACAVAGLAADFEVHIRNAEAVNKSYPGFYDHLLQLGVSLQTEESITNPK